MSTAPGADTDTPRDVSGRSVAPPRGGLLRNILHLSLGQAATTVLAIVLSAAVARTLGASEFGLLYLVMTIGTFAYVFVDWGHAAYVTREIARHPARAGELIGTVTAVRVATALVVCGPVVAITWLLGYDFATIALSVTLIVAWLPGYVGMSYSWVFRGCERMDYDALINVVQKLCTLVVALMCLALGGRVVSLVVFSVVSGTITTILAVVLYRRLHLPQIRVTRAAAYELFHGGAPMLAFGITVAVQPYLNANILHALVPTTVLGWYGVTWNIAGTLLAPATILAAAVYPRFSKAASDPGELQRVLRTAFRPLLLVAVLGAVGTYLFADVAIAVVYSEQKFGRATEILQAFAPGLLLLYVDMFLGSALLAVGKTVQLTAVRAVAVMVTTALGYVLTSEFQTRYGNGGIGIMIAVAIGEMVMVFAVIVMLREAVDKRMFADMFRALIAGSLTMAIIRALPVETPFVTIPACIVAFLALSMALGLITRADLESLADAFGRRSLPEGTPGDALSPNPRITIDPL